MNRHPMMSAPHQTALRVESLHTLAELHELRSEWERLEESAGQAATIYQTWAWVVTWYEHFGDDKTLEVLVLRDAEGRLVGIAPWSRSVQALGRLRLVHSLGRGNDLTEYVDALLHPDHADAAVRAIFEHWDERRGEWELLSLPCLPGDGALGASARRLAGERDYWYVADQHTRVSIALPGSWEDYWAGLGRNMRKHLRKFANRLKRSGLEPELRVVEDEAELDGAIETFLSLHRLRAESDLSYEHPLKFTTSAHCAFIRAVSRRLLERGRLWLCSLHIDGEPVAAQMCFSLGKRLYAYHSGYDPKWAWHAVMMSLFRRCLERAIAQGFEEFDLGLGNDQEKLRWGGQPRPVLNLRAASPRAASRAAFLVGLQQRARRRAEGTYTTEGPPEIQTPMSGAFERWAMPVTLMLRQGLQ
jgi:CelD/BcsL family acetyltransferase involved in cellulose biosynthesis